MRSAACCLLVLAGLGVRESAAQRLLDTRDVEITIKRIADWQLEHPVAIRPTHPALAPLYDGLIDVSETTGDPRYLAAVIRAGRRCGFQVDAQLDHPGAVAVGHAWLRIYAQDPTDPAPREPLERRFDRRAPTGRWTSADALYMALPVLGLMSRITGDARYLAFADAAYGAAYTALYDRDAQLFYQDVRSIGDRTPSGKKVLWSRANGWVYAGLARYIDTLPPDHPMRSFYLELFEMMTEAVLDTQQPDGMWYPSLADPLHVATGETSGTALFIFGLAWGLHHHVLARRTALPAIERGWDALRRHVGSTGEVTGVQPIGAGPEPFDPASREPFGTGAVLMAGAEILRALSSRHRGTSAQLIFDARALVRMAPDLSVLDPAARAGDRDHAFERCFASGNVKKNSLPCDGVVSTHSCPPCASMMPFAM